MIFYTKGEGKGGWDVLLAQEHRVYHYGVNKRFPIGFRIRFPPTDISCDKQLSNTAKSIDYSSS